MNKNKSFAICAQLGSITTPIATLAFLKDGSFSVQDRFIPGILKPIYQYFQVPFPINQVGLGKTIEYDGPIYYSRAKPKLSHHAVSGYFHISNALTIDGNKITSGFENDKPKGIGNRSFELHKTTNDGGPIVTGTFWGLDRMPNLPVKTSESIFFRETNLRDQVMNYKGPRQGVALDIFHFKKNSNSLKYIDEHWARYIYRHRKYPVLVRAVDPGPNHEYLLGISCYLMRFNRSSSYGVCLGGGPGIIDEAKGTCTNTFFTFEIPTPQIPPNAQCIDRNLHDKGIDCVDLLETSLN